jgi:hypothetical protein
MSRRKLLGGLALTVTLWIGFSQTAQAQNAAESPSPTPAAPPAGQGEPPSLGAPVATLPAAPAPPPEAQPPQKNLSLDPPAQGPFSNLMGPTVGHLQPRADYRVTWFPEEPVKGQPTTLAEERQDFSFICPLWQDAANEWSASIHVRSELFQTNAILPTTGQPFPDNLWDVRLGASYRHLFDNGWVAGGGVSVGSASDKPFHGYDEMSMGVNAFLRIPQGEHNAWLFTLAYSPNSELAFPVPGVAFLWQPTDCLRVNVGLPFALMYRPVDDLTLELSYMLVRTVHARATYRACDKVRIYTGYDWMNESYFLADREDLRDRFFYYDQRVTGGMQYFLNRQALFDLSAGYTFDRFYFEGRQYSDQNRNRVDVGAGPFLSLRFQWKF